MFCLRLTWLTTPPIAPSMNAGKMEELGLVNEHPR